MPLTKLRPTFTFDEDRLAQLRAVVPEAFADGKINWETLRAALGEHLEDDEADAEHFGLFWPGKRAARRLASQPSRGTLVPQPGLGVNEATTRNLFIEGDNLEVLKLLLKSYAGRVKLIYIDPPYNTGNDFIYSDDFTEPLEAYLRRTGQVDEGGQPLTTNPKASGRFHSNWLNMMYPRLLLARQLLCDDGVILVSINDSEAHHLRQIMNEIFGEENFVAQFVWNTEGHTDNQFQVKINHEYILLYAKNWAAASLGYVVDPNTREESNLWKGFAENSITKNGPANPPSEVVLPIGFPCAVEYLNLAPTGIPPDFFVEVETLGYISRPITQKYDVSYPIIFDSMIVRDGKLVSPCRVYSGWANVNKLRDFIQHQCVPMQDENGDIIRFYLSERGVVYYRKDRQKARNILSVLRNMGTTEKMRSDLEQMGVYFQYPKPKELLKYLIQIALDDGGIVLDFFAGSCTTAHAVLELNQEDRNDRSFIMVQLPEAVPIDSPAYKSGYKTIADIGRERIRRVIARMQAEAAGQETTDDGRPATDDGQLSLLEPGPSSASDGQVPTNEGQQTPDLGFKCYRLARSHFKAWQDYTGAELAELETLFTQFESPLVEGWEPSALLTELLLLEGFPLDSRVRPLPAFTANTLLEVSSDFCAHRLTVCLDARLHPETLAALDLRAEDTFICLESALDDEAKLRLADRCNLKVV